jgi:hypothetical protein
MSLLTTLKLVSSQKSRGMPPIVQRRQKLIHKLHEQIMLAKALRDGQTYAPLVLKTIKNRDTGERKTLEMPKRIREWWFVNESGKLNLVLKYGSKQIEFTKGKNAIELANQDELITVLETLKKAVEDGELDSQITQTSGAIRSVFEK